MLARASILLALLGLAPSAALSGQAGDRPPGAAGGEIRGRVYGQRAGEPAPLPHVMLDLSKGLDHRTVATDSLGMYSAPGLAPGRWRVQALHVGFQSLALEVLLPADGVVALDFELTAKPIALPPVLVRARPLALSRPGESASAREVGEVSLRALEGSTGMVEAGLAQVVRTLPGNGHEADPTDVLLMRGSAADLKLVLLDGAPIYTPFHLGGLLESFDPRALGSASLFLGGAPARFDGGLSYILDLKTRSPRRDRFRGEAAADLLTGRLLLEGPILAGGVLLGTRRIHDLGTSPLGRGKSPYGYQDVLLRGEWGDAEGINGFLSGFWNREEVWLDLGDSETAFDGEASWGNKAVAGGLSGAWNRFTGEIRAAVSRYDAHLPVADSLPLFAQSRSDRIRLTADLSHPWGDGVLRVGASTDRMVSDYAARGLDSLGAVVESEMNLRGTSGGVYLEGTRHLAPSLTLRGGLRLDHFSGDDGIRAAPRAAISWLLTDNAVLTLAAGRYHQFSALSSVEVEETLSNATGGPGTQSVTGHLTVGASNHLVIAMDQILAPGLRFGLEGFVKNFSGITGAENERLNSSGVDLRVAREGTRASGWFGYTLTWFWASESGFLGSDARFAGRHLLSAGLSTRLSERTGFRLRVGYGNGLPYTSIPIFKNGTSDSGVDSGQGPRNEVFTLNGDNVLNEAPALAIGPDQGFLRVEGEIFGSWSRTIGGRVHEFRPYLRVLNALNRRDALFYHFDPWRNPNPRPLAELPVLPLLGLEWVF